MAALGHGRPIDALPSQVRSAAEADTLNRMVRSRFTLPGRKSFKPDLLRAPSNSLNYRASNIRTKTAVVRLHRRKSAERDEKRPELDPQAGRHGSDNLPGMAAVCGFPTADQERKKKCPDMVSWRTEGDSNSRFGGVGFRALAPRRAMYTNVQIVHSGWTSLPAEPRRSEQEQTKGVASPDLNLHVQPGP
jgi:hypothetical protein